MRKLTNLARGLKLVLATTAVAAVLAFQPGPAAAQTAGFGGDGYTRAMWRGTDGSVGLWLFNPNLNFAGSHFYGPYPGYSPVALTTANGTNLSYVLWTYTDGQAVVWELDPNLNFITSRSFGPISGWKPDGLGVGAATGNVGLVWKSTQNQVAVWVLNPSLSPMFSSPVYGPYFGWKAP